MGLILAGTIVLTLELKFGQRARQAGRLVKEVPEQGQAIPATVARIGFLCPASCCYNLRQFGVPGARRTQDWADH